MTESRHTLPLPWTAPPLSLNDGGITKGAKFARAKTIRDVRQTILTLARAAKLPRDIGHVAVQLHYQPRDNRARDTDNLVASLKPMCDALTPGKPPTTYRRKGVTKIRPAVPGYGMVADDTPRFMAKPEPIIHRAAKGEPGRLWLEIHCTADPKELPE